MKKTRRPIFAINEGVYDFYNEYDKSNDSTEEKILNYYIEKIRKFGLDSLTEEEKKLFEEAKRGKLTLDKPVYRRSKLTGDIEYDSSGKPIRLDKDNYVPGIPFVTSKGRGIKREEIIEGRIYWNVDEDYKVYYVYGGESDDNNPRGLVIWKTQSKDPTKEFGAFIVPKKEINLTPEELWANLNNKYDKGVILNKEAYKNFIIFDKLYHDSRKQYYDKLIELVRYLKNYVK